MITPHSFGEGRHGGGVGTLPFPNGPSPQATLFKEAVAQKQGLVVPRREAIAVLSVGNPVSSRERKREEFKVFGGGWRRRVLGRRV